MCWPEFRTYAEDLVFFYVVVPIQSPLLLPHDGNRLPIVPVSACE